MPRVFLAEPNGRYNVDNAKPYGEITLLSEVIVSPFATDVSMRIFRDALAQHNFNPDEDFICLTGNPPIIALMFAAVLCGYPRVKVLFFDARTSQYRERVVEDPYEEVGS